MIKVGITGCDDLRAAELIRVLINHPDVDLKWVTASCPPETRLDSIVHGIVGESDLIANHIGGVDDVDVIFACGRDDLSHLTSQNMSGSVSVIDLTGAHNLDHGGGKPWTYGMSEMQRRVLVHDATHVTVPGCAAVASLLAVMPMARNLLLNNPLTLRVAVGSVMYPDDVLAWTRQQRDEVALALTLCQSSFNQPIDLSVTQLAERRSLAVAARFKCGVDEEMIRQLYEQYYADHNFVFLVDRPVVTADVENTNKCLIRLDKDERSGMLTVHAVMDALLKGCVGNAVHSMNLMFGLHERVGLALKASGC